MLLGLKIHNNQIRNKKIPKINRSIIFIHLITSNLQIFYVYSSVKNR